MIKLASTKPFAQGGNRLCYVHPDDKSKVVKVRRPDFTLEDLRKKKGFPKSLKPLSSFDDNLEEFKVLSAFQKKYGEHVFKHISRCYGFEETDQGKGLILELVRDGNGLISYNIKQYLYEVGPTESFNVALDAFCNFWQETSLPSRNLLAHNVLVQQDDMQRVVRLVVIDGLGYSGFFPKSMLTASYFEKRAKKKVSLLRQDVEKYIARAKRGERPTEIGILLHRDAD